MFTAREIKEQKPDNPGIWNSYDVFQKYFIRKSFNTLLLKISENLLRRRGYNASQINRMKGFIYLTLLAVQGSLVTSGPSFGVTEILKYFQYAEDNAYWAGFTTGIIVSLTLDLTPWGITKTVISTIGSIAGRRTSLWAYEQMNIAVGADDFIEEERVIYQP